MTQCENKNESPGSLACVAGIARGGGGGGGEWVGDREEREKGGELGREGK